MVGCGSITMHGNRTVAAPPKVAKHVVHIAPCKGMPPLASEKKSRGSLSPQIHLYNIIHLLKIAVKAIESSTGSKKWSSFYYRLQ